MVLQIDSRESTYTGGCPFGRKIVRIYRIQEVTYQFKVQVLTALLQFVND